MRIDADIDDAAADHHVQPQLASARDHGWTVGAGIQPDFAGRLLGDLLQDTETAFGRQIETDPVETIHGDSADHGIGFVPLDGRGPRMMGKTS